MGLDPSGGRWPRQAAVARRAIQVRQRHAVPRAAAALESVAMSPTPSAQYSLTIRVEIADRPGMLGQVASAIGDAGGRIGAVDLVEVKERVLLRDITVDTAGNEQWDSIVAALDAIDGVTVIDTTDRTFL